MPDIPIRVHRGGHQYGVRFQNDRLPDDYFSTGVWSQTSAGPELRRYTCLVCGARRTTLASFRAHRKGCTDIGSVDPELAALTALAILEEMEEGGTAPGGADDEAPPEVAA